MIKVSITKTNEVITNINVNGHSGYDEYGKDIVCASVSSIIITTVNGLLRLDSDSIKYEEKDGFINIDILKHDNVIDTLILNMISLLEELQKDYKNNIIIK